jgi:hypothetical protein
MALVGSMKTQYYLGGAVPAGGDIFGDKARNVLDTGSGAGEAETTDLQIAILVEQKIRGLKVAMQDTNEVYSLESAQSLPDGVRAVVIGELPGTNRFVQVRVHWLLDEVDLGKAVVVPWLFDM